MIYGTIPAAGLGSRLQPLGFSKELALVRDQAVIEYLLERMTLAGINKIFIVIDPDKLDIPKYLSTKSPHKNNLVYIVKKRQSLSDDLFAPIPFLKDNDSLFFGLPDTIWYPKNGFNLLKKERGEVVLGLFLSDHPENFGSVLLNDQKKIIKIEDKIANPQSRWIWGMGKTTVKAAKKILEILPASDKPEDRVLSRALDLYKEKYPCFGLQIKNSKYFDIGKKEDYQKANEFVQKNESIS